MTNKLNTIVLAKSARDLSTAAPHYEYEDTAQGLWYIYNNRTNWYSGDAITETDKEELFAADIFLHLGSLAHALATLQPLTQVDNRNPLKDPTLRILDDIIDDEAGRFPTEVPFEYIGSVPKPFYEYLEEHVERQREYLAKSAIAAEVIARRGMVTTQAYNIEEMLAGIESIEHIPDGFNVSASGEPLEVFNVGEMIDRAGVQTHEREFPYYNTYNQRKAPAMLMHALEDLRDIKYALETYDVLSRVRNNIDD